MSEKRQIQYVANPKALKKPRVVNPGGKQKDFYAGRDRDFIRHRDQIKSDLEAISAKLASDHAAFNGEGFVEVRLTQEAWAKSHRPVDKLFGTKNATLIGSNEIADLIFRVSAASTNNIAKAVGEAEDHGKPKINKRTQQEEIVVSEFRSETGSIEAITLWGAEQRAAPSVDEAIKHLRSRHLAAYYRVELFDSIGFTPDADEASDILVADFWRRLKRLAQNVGLAVTYDTDSSHPAIGIALLTGEPRLVVRPEREFVGESNLLSLSANFSPDNHSRLLSLLTGHPLVKSIGLPAVVEPPRDLGLIVSKASKAMPADVDDKAIRAIIGKRGRRWNGDNEYPRVCVVDGGISDDFARWIVHQEQVIADRNEDHGSNIASLLVAGRALNKPIADFLEEDGCELIDLAMVPPKRAAVGATYPGGATTFLDQLDRLIGEVKKEHPFRIINMSLNIDRQVPKGSISDSGRRLDEIARKHDVIFVVSAGNALGAAMRTEWPHSTTEALQTLLGDSDRLHEPADTLANVSVAALNPLGVEKVIPKAPARYSRRGAEQRTVKPDLCHFGGAVVDRGGPTGVVVTDANQELRYVNGTSYAAPLIAKTLAQIDADLGGRAPREVLLALLYHSAQLHDPMNDKDLRAAAKQLVGFGLPGTASQALGNSDSSFTFVFFDRLREGESFSHDFEWPASLTTHGGACTGAIRATLVSSPPVVHKYGAEASRMNIDLFVRQHNGKRTAKGEMSFTKRVDAVHSLGAPKGKTREASLLSHSLKWSPVKIYEGLHANVGESSTWRFGVDYLERDKTQVNMPKEGVAVAVIVTISDPEGRAPVFDEMRASLVRAGLRLQDIRAAIRAQSKI